MLNIGSTYDIRSVSANTTGKHWFSKTLLYILYADKRYTDKFLAKFYGKQSTAFCGKLPCTVYIFKSDSGYLCVPQSTRNKISEVKG